jgi:hypothetical protein
MQLVDVCNAPAMLVVDHRNPCIQFVIPLRYAIVSPRLVHVDAPRGTPVAICSVSDTDVCVE